MVLVFACDFPFGFDCEDPLVLACKLNKSDMTYEFNARKKAAAMLRNKCHSLKLNIYPPTPDAWDSFYSAISDQLQFWESPWKRNGCYQLLNDVVALVRGDPYKKPVDYKRRSKYSNEEDYCKSAHADIVVAMAKMLEHDIFIVLRGKVLKIKGGLGSDDTAIQLVIGHFYEMRYQSLRPWDDKSSGKKHPVLLEDLNCGAIICQDKQMVDTKLRESEHSFQTEVRKEAIARLADKYKDNRMELHGDNHEEGMCFFHALSDQLSLLNNWSGPHSVSQLQTDLADYMRRHETVKVSEAASNLCCIDSSCTLCFKEIFKGKKRPDAFVVVAMANMLGITIYINDLLEANRKKHTTTCLEVRGGGPGVKLVHVHGMHYQSLVNMKRLPSEVLRTKLLSTQCPLCFVKFHNLDLMQTHLRNHGAIFECCSNDDCEEVFPTQWARNIHLREKHNYSCCKMQHKMPHKRSIGDSSPKHINKNKLGKTV